MTCFRISNVFHAISSDVSKSTSIGQYQYQSDNPPPTPHPPHPLTHVNAATENFQWAVETEAMNEHEYMNICM